MTYESLQHQYNLVCDIYDIYYVSLCNNGYNHRITQVLRNSFFQELVLYKAYAILKFDKNIINE